MSQLLFFSLKAALLGLLLIALGLTFLEPPKKIYYPHPQAEQPAYQVTYDFWGAMQSGSTWAVSNSDCSSVAPDISKGDLKLVENTEEVELNKNRFQNILCRLTSANLKSKTDLQLPNILAAAHSWRAQAGIDPKSVESDLSKARHHAGQAVSRGNKLAGGFEASPTWLLGYIKNHDELKNKGYKQMVDDSISFAAFHGYVEGALVSAMLDPDKDNGPYEYKWAIISLLENLEACLFGESVLRAIHLPEGMRINHFMMNLVSRISIISGQGYCYNNAAAPFNIPGLYITQGDAYLKAGDIELARIAYENALASPNAAYWPFAEHVQIRLNDMNGIRKKFIDDSYRFEVDQKPTAMTAQASWFCAACHQWPAEKRRAVLNEL